MGEKDASFGSLGSKHFVMVGSENTNAAENDRINRNLLILRQTTEKEKKGSMFSNKHGLAARMKLNDQSIGCFHLWASSTALTPYVISRQPTYMKRRIGFSGIPRSKAAQRIGNEAQSGLRGWARLLSPYIGRGGSQVARSKITISALVVISGLKESTKANKVDSLLSQLATGIAADPVVFLFYGLSAGRVKVESRSSPTGERQGMILLRYELAEGMKSEIGVQSSAFKDAMNQIGLEAQSLLDQFEIVPLIPINIGNFYFSFTNPSLFMLLTLSFFLLLIHYITKKGGGNLVPNAWQSLVELLYDFVLNLVKEQIGGLSGNVKQMFFPCILGMIPYSFTVTSHFLITLALSFPIFISITIVGFQRHGFHFFSFLLPAGVPLPLAPFLVLLELISYCFRALSLGIRLFANMIAGHSLVKILSGFAWTMLCMNEIFYFIGALGPLFIVLALTGLELGVAILQAYLPCLPALTIAASRWEVGEGSLLEECLGYLHSTCYSRRKGRNPVLRLVELPAGTKEEAPESARGKIYSRRRKRVQTTRKRKPLGIKPYYLTPREGGRCWVDSPAISAVSPVDSPASSAVTRASSPSKHGRDTSQLARRARSCCRSSRRRARQ
ncbi:hypothetical protein HID58_042899 [Brassica napus]|uniref:F-ATPase protein 6 n=1 Tax=Brassica napus TaxID=3708 RepID=A0ABQ8BGR4_BRANA|nr:hypothetical protein HID58_042899 [Brassica napus]